MCDPQFKNLPNEYFAGKLNDVPLQLNRLLIEGSETNSGSVVLNGNTVMTIGHTDDGLKLRHPILKVGGRSDLYSVSISTYKNDCIIGRNDNYHYSPQYPNCDQDGSLLIRSKGRFKDDGLKKQEGLEVYHGTKLTTLDDSGNSILSNINSEYYSDRQHRLSYTYNRNTQKTNMTNISDTVNIHSNIRTIISVGGGADENNLEDLHSFINLSKEGDGKFINLPNIKVPQIKLTSDLIDINGSVQTKDNLIIGDRTGINYRFTTKKRVANGDNNTYYLTIDKYNGEINLGSICDFDRDNDGEEFVYD